MWEYFQFYVSFATRNEAKSFIELVSWLIVYILLTSKIFDKKFVDKIGFQIFTDEEQCYLFLVAIKLFLFLKVSIKKKEIEMVTYLIIFSNKLAKSVYVL